MKGACCRKVLDFSKKEESGKVLKNRFSAKNEYTFEERCRFSRKQKSRKKSGFLEKGSV
jgi:hypothetical protein